MSKPDIVERLQVAIQAESWDPVAKVMFRDALAEIERLRRLAGAVSQGESFAEVRQQVRRGI